MCLLFLLVLLFSAAPDGGAALERIFQTTTHYNNFVTWSEAQAYCREHHTDLVSLRNEQEQDELVPPHGWIGLYRENSSSDWKWSRRNQHASYFNWDQHITTYEHCAYMYSDQRGWYLDPCYEKHSFTCSDEKLVLVKEKKTWEEALDHCRSLWGVDTKHPALPYRSHKYDLASLTTDNDHAQALTLAQEAATDEVWTGLRFLAGGWWWVNGEWVRYQGMRTCPGLLACGVLEKTSNGDYEIRDCKERRNFLCFKRPETSDPM